MNVSKIVKKAVLYVENEKLLKPFTFKYTLF